MRKQIKVKDMVLNPVCDQRLSFEASRIVIIWSNYYKVFKSDSSARKYQNERTFAFAYRIVQVDEDDFELLPCKYSEIFKKYISEDCKLGFFC